MKLAYNAKTVVTKRHAMFNLGPIVTSHKTLVFSTSNWNWKCNLNYQLQILILFSLLVTFRYNTFWVGHSALSFLAKFFIKFGTCFGFHAAKTFHHLETSSTVFPANRHVSHGFAQTFRHVLSLHEFFKTFNFATTIEAIFTDFPCPMFFVSFAVAANSLEIKKQIILKAFMFLFWFQCLLLITQFIVYVTLVNSGTFSIFWVKTAAYIYVFYFQITLKMSDDFILTKQKNSEWSLG